MKIIAEFFDEALSSGGDEKTLASVRAKTLALCNQYPLP